MPQCNLNVTDTNRNNERIQQLRCQIITGKWAYIRDPAGLPITKHDSFFNHLLRH